MTAQSFGLDCGRGTVPPTASAPPLSSDSAYPETLDPGERDLFAHALSRADAWIASCADRRAVMAALELGWEERLVSPEVLVHAAGANRALQYHYTERWLSDVRTAFKLDRGLK